MKHNKTNININKTFNNYIKLNFNGLSVHTLTQVLADFMRTGWDAEYYIAPHGCDDDFNRWHYLRCFVENPVVNFKYVGCNNTLRMHDTSFTHLAAFLVEEDLFNHMVRRNNPDLFDTIDDIVRTCPYL